MKKLLLSAAALMAIAAPAFAEGSGDINLGYRTVEDGDVDGVDYGGAAHVGFSDNWNLQLDAQNTRNDFDGGSLTTTQGAAHVFYRTEGWSAGGFVSYGDALLDSAYGIGAEGQLYLGQFTVGGSLEHVTFDNDFFISEDSAMIANLRGGFFITDNLNLHAGVHYLDADGLEELVDYSVGGEWRLDSAPLSIYADYRSHDEDAFDTDSWSLGVRWAFGDSSLLDRERGGPGQQRGSNLSQFFPVLTP